MINPSETIKYYFDCLKEAGEQIDFDVYEAEKGQCSQKYNFDHRNFDGISAFAQISRDKKYNIVFPKLKQLPPPPFYLRMTYFLHWWTVAQFKRVPKTNKRKATHPVFVWRQRRLLISQKNDRKFFAKILLALHQSLSINQQPTLWMLPVALYQDHEMNKQMPPSNQVSFLDLKVTKNKSYEDLNQEIKKGLEKGYQWGTIYSLHVAQLLGKKLFIKLFPFFSSRLQRTGTLSNMGTWSFPEFSSDKGLVARSVVVEMNPISANFMIINDILNLCMNFHPSYGMTEEEGQQLIATWEENLFKLLTNE
ncbi:MAG: hypothetical protein ACOYL6_18240 [Bacteriovoracaceae bacterium]